jgi:hypothetical protein
MAYLGYYPFVIYHCEGWEIDYSFSTPQVFFRTKLNLDVIHERCNWPSVRHTNNFTLWKQQRKRIGLVFRISIRDEGGGTSTKWTTKTLEGEKKRFSLHVWISRSLGSNFSFCKWWMPVFFFFLFSFFPILWWCLSSDYL